MRSKILLFTFAALVFFALIAATFFVGFSFGGSYALASAGNPDQFRLFPGDRDISGLPELLAGPDLSSAAGTPEELEATFAPFWEAWDLVHEKYVEQPVDDTRLMQGAISGMMDSLGDPYSAYMDPDSFLQFKTQYDGEYSGIGAWVDPSAEYLTIISPMPGSPAEEVGLKPGDEIIAVDGEDMTGIDGNLVIRRVVGPAGSTVQLTVRREGEAELLEFEVERATIVVPSVESEMLEDEIGYIHLIQFREDSVEELRAAFLELQEAGAERMILDLRNNPGGLLSSAIQVSSEFIAEGALLYQEYGDGRRDTHEALEGGLATDIPLIVLINGGSASASEILAGAIQAYDRAILVGETTFGKGSVQLPIELQDENGAVRITIARWLTPDDRLIHGVGIEPDVPVEFTEEDLAREVDPQLEKALELVKERD